ncbi:MULTISPECIES: vWA domain-containing protein [Thiorhodovibrio]|uniref:vWA domain-containing protein n=1 Tax=Thiorhodovibrio TaxID=61593 RepID=UPI001912009A|nr:MULTISPECIES: VWA-like domain-containing protein [Thiorhodovibrio]MBK5970827.1 hypothetical protein [Thiorhodovibrio winogradskyi]WPL10781.1 hypothetical protein Thiosp_00499 [Thiorhodovibrio litoralis]
MADTASKANEVDLTALETKLAAARTRLILDKPFLGSLVLRLPLRAANASWCPTTATDARAFYFNPDYIDALSLAETQFMLAHEALHCALSHFARRQHRVKHKWDLACDYAINPLLIDEGLKPPPNALFMPPYLGMTAEEIYPLIDDNDQSETLDTHAYDQDNDSQQGSQGQGLNERDLAERGRSPESRDSESGGTGGADQASGQQGTGQAVEDSSPDERRQGGDDGPPPLTPDERETLSVQWQQRMAGAAQQAMQAGKLGGELRRLIDHLLQPQLPWRALLARYMSALARDDYSYARPSRREGEFLLPRLRSDQLDLVVGLDTSGSIRDAEIEEFIAEIDALKGQIRARVTLLPCDAALAPGAPFEFEPWETFDRPERLHGQGGTSFVPVFNWLSDQGRRPDLLLYFTDAEGAFPPAAPAYPVLWLVKGRSPVPWGERIQLN